MQREEGIHLIVQKSIRSDHCCHHRLLVEMLHRVMMDVFEQFGLPAISSIAKDTPGLAAAALTIRMWTSDYFRIAAKFMHEEAPRRSLNLAYKATAIHFMLDQKTVLSNPDAFFQDNYRYGHSESIHDLASLMQGSLLCGVQLFTYVLVIFLCIPYSQFIQEDHRRTCCC